MKKAFLFIDGSYIIKRNKQQLKNISWKGTENEGKVDKDFQTKLFRQSTNKLVRDLNAIEDIKIIDVFVCWDKKPYAREELVSEFSDLGYKGDRIFYSNEEIDELFIADEIKERMRIDNYNFEQEVIAKKELKDPKNKANVYKNLELRGLEADDWSWYIPRLMQETHPDITPIICSSDSDWGKGMSKNSLFYKVLRKEATLFTYDEWRTSNTKCPETMDMWDFTMYEQSAKGNHNNLNSCMEKKRVLLKKLVPALESGDESLITNPELYHAQLKCFNVMEFAPIKSGVAKDLFLSEVERKYRMSGQPDMKFEKRYSLTK